VSLAPAPLLEQPLVRARIVSAGPARRLRRLGIETIGDLLFHLPRRYDDFSRPMTLRQLRERPPEGPVSATVEILDLRVEQGFRRRVQRTVARLRDETGEGEAIWFGRRYIERRLAPGQTVALAGKVEVRGWLPRFVSPEFGAAGDAALHAGRIVPIYRLTEGLTAGWLRQRMRQALDLAVPQLAEYLPPSVRPATGETATGIGDAIEWIHFPPDFERLDRAIGRLAFDELFALQVGMVARSRQRGQETAPRIPVASARLREAVAVVEGVIARQVAARQAAAAAEADGVRDTTDEAADIRLTEDQRSAVEQLVADLSAGRPMMRLLQGDVGSGKTAVAALAMTFVADVGGQAALLAPTDLLARQHLQTLASLLEPLGHDVTLLTGSLGVASRREVLELLAAPLERTTDGRTRGRITVGTHALVQQAVAFADLRLVVVDEQHRFGVAEREALATKGTAPHVLLMTATPIPRTLGQIVHADLDVSDLHTPPAGRREIRTGIRRSDELVRRHDGREGALPLLARAVAAGHRGFVVVPLVEEDEASDARSVEQAAQLLRDSWPAALEAAGLRPAEPLIEIVHGQLRAAERDERMERFRRGEAQVLVGTTVIEVGVDVPEATVMIVLDADRFGVAQLHQLRGRVGRGEAQSYCVLVSERYPVGEPISDEEAAVKARLDAVAGTTDGFALAEMDLEQRREGDLLGLTQSGLPPLRIASLQKPSHRALSVEARRHAEALLDERGRLPAAAALLEEQLTRGWLRRVGAGEVLAGAADTAAADGDKAATAG
jgi:ATP-dependent DNA helicase RecG